MQLLDARAARVLITICVFVAVGAFLYGVRRPLVVFLFAIFFAYLLEPLVARIEKSPLAFHSRGLAIAETYLIVAIGLIVLGAIFGPQLVKDTHELVESAPNLLQNIGSGKIVWQFGSQHGWSYDTQLRIEQLVSSHRGVILNWLEQLGANAAQLLTNALWVALIPILAIFFLADGRRFAQAAIDAVDRRDQRRLLRSVLNDLDRMLAGFIFAQIILVAFSLVAYSVVLLLLRFPYALALGLAGGMMEFVPVVGPLVAAAVILGVGFLAGFSHMWAVLLFLAVWRVCQDYIVAPRVYGRGLELHPLVAIAAVLMGGELGGVIGVYLAIPIAAATRVIWERWQDYSDTVNPDASQLQEIPPAAPRKTAVR